MSTQEEEKLVDELVKDLYNLFYPELIDNPVLTPIVYSRIIRFIRDFTKNEDFILGEE